MDTRLQQHGRAQKAAFASFYKAGVQALVPLGWLTQPQATILIGLANQL